MRKPKRKPKAERDQDALTQHMRVRIALQKCAGALACSVDGRTTITFNGAHAYLGRATVEEILFQANEALEDSEQS